MKAILTVCSILLLFTCKQAGNGNNNNIEKSLDVSKVPEEKDKLLDEAEMIPEVSISNPVDDELLRDSIRFETILNDALIIAQKHISAPVFFKEYTVYSDNEPGVRVEIDLQYHFTNKKTNLIIRRFTPIDVYIDIYWINKNSFEKTLSYEQWIMTYINDTIRDINGDGIKDFVVNWHGASGCCLKAFSDVYLLSDDQKTFSESFEFINPTFSPKEKVVRGVGYGHPGETEMYKYRWNGMKMDTVEYVYYEKAGLNRKVIVVNYDPENKEVLRQLDDVPNEYKNIYGYDWFTGNL